MKITKKRAAVALTVLGLATGTTVAVMTVANASVTPNSACSPHGAVTHNGNATLICAVVPTSQAFRWREITGTGPVGPKGPAGPAGPAGAPGKDGAPGTPGKDGTNGKDGNDGVSGLQADGPYPGSSHVSGGNSDSPWAAGTKMQTAWVRCPAGKKALGGGFSAETGGADVHVVSSYPMSLDANGKYDDNGQLSNADASILPNAWVVEGYYTADSGSAQVRPWVVCAKVS